MDQKLRKLDRSKTPVLLVLDLAHKISWLTCFSTFRFVCFFPIENKHCDLEAQSWN